METIDLDAARKARGSKESAQVRFKGQVFPITKGLPFRVFRELDRKDEVEAMEMVLQQLLGENIEKFYELDPELEDVAELVEGAFRAMRRKTGESSDS